MGDAVDSLGLGDVELTYQLCEGGERVVLVHASAFVSWYDPLAEQLMDYSTLRYRRDFENRTLGDTGPLQSPKMLQSASG